jgi:hypothetical protein
MGFLSTVIMSMLEKELAAQEPGAEQYLLNELSVLGNDLIAFVEKKIGLNAPAQLASTETSSSQ